MKNGSRIVSITGLILMTWVVIIHQPWDLAIKDISVSIALLLSAILLALGELMDQIKKRDELAKEKRNPYVRSGGE